MEPCGLYLHDQTILWFKTPTLLRATQIKYAWLITLLSLYSVMGHLFFEEIIIIQASLFKKIQMPNFVVLQKCPKDGTFTSPARIYTI
jgi:hypothetical protein